jgi:hypothetical protein
MKDYDALELGRKVKNFGTIHSSLVTKSGELMVRMFMCKSTHGYLYAIFVYFDDVPEKMVHLTDNEMIAIERMIEISGQLAA